MKRYLGIILVIVFLALETSLGPFIKIGGASPHLLLLLGLSFGMCRGPIPGARIGLLSGLLEDMALGRFIGISALAKGLTAYLVGLVGQKVFRDNLFLVLSLGFMGSLLSQAIVLGPLSLAGYGPALSSLTLRLVLSSALYDALLFPFFFWGIRRLSPIARESNADRIPGV